jgi:tRNA nucleotidyltransferase (CCA-adding enzyme)
VTPHAILQHLASASEILKHLQRTKGSTVYLVGGILRDIFLDVHTLNNDLDFVIEGNTEQVVKEIQNSLGGTLTSHPEFGTFSLKTQDYILDFITARDETYLYPGALPTVRFSTIQDDLARRDFTINTLALRLHPLELLDPHHGLDDLRDKLLRILHPGSFLDDPTRIIRGARLAGRLGFRWEPGTQEKIPEALQSEAISNISKDRLKAELELCLAESRVHPVIKELERCGILQGYFALSHDPEMIQKLDRYRQHQALANESYLLALFLKLKHPESFLEDFHYPMRYLESLQRIKAGLQHMSSNLFPHLSLAEKWVLRASSQELEQRLEDLEQIFARRRLSGQDVLDLGLLSGPSVGYVLAEVAKARDQGQVSDFAQEYELARRLVIALQETQ